MRITRCLFGIDIKAIHVELQDREHRHQAKMTDLSNRLRPVPSSNAHLRQALALLHAEIAAMEESRDALISSSVPKAPNPMNQPIRRQQL